METEEKKSESPVLRSPTISGVHADESGSVKYGTKEDLESIIGRGRPLSVRLVFHGNPSRYGTLGTSTRKGY